MAGRLIVESGRNYISHTEPESRSRLEDVLPPPYERLMGAIAGVRSSRPMSLKLSVNQKRPAEFCRQNGARRLAALPCRNRPADLAFRYRRSLVCETD